MASSFSTQLKITFIFSAAMTERKFVKGLQQDVMETSTMEVTDQEENRAYRHACKVVSKPK